MLRLEPMPRLQTVGTVLAGSWLLLASQHLPVPLGLSWAALTSSHFISNLHFALRHVFHHCFSGRLESLGDIDLPTE